MTLRKTTFSRNTVMLYIYIFLGGGVGGGVGCGNVPIKNNANHILFQKAKYMYLYTIPPVWSIHTLNPEEKAQL